MRQSEDKEREYVLNVIINILHQFFTTTAHIQRYVLGNVGTVLHVLFNKNHTHNTYIPKHLELLVYSCTGDTVQITSTLTLLICRTYRQNKYFLVNLKHAAPNKIILIMHIIKSSRFFKPGGYSSTDISYTLLKV